MSSSIPCTAIIVALLAGLPAAAVAQCEPGFIVDSTQGYGFTLNSIPTSPESPFSSVNQATRWDPDGDGPLPAWLVLGGRFTRAANVNSMSVVAWDGGQWQGFGLGLPPTSPLPTPPQITQTRTVLGMGTFQGDLIVIDGAIRRWNGSEWALINPDRNPSFLGTLATDLTEHEGSLYIGGMSSFLGSNNQSVLRPLAARVVGNNFERVGLALRTPQESARKFLSRPEGLYAAGLFTSLTDDTVLNNIALWNGATWSSVGGGVNAACDDAAFINDQLYVVGTFTQAGGQPIRAVAHFDGTQWQQVGDGSLTSATSIIEIGGQIYVSGQTATNLGVYQLDGASWTWLQGGFLPTRLTQDNGELIAMGRTSTGLDQGVQFPAEDAIRLTADGWKALGAPYDYVGGVGVVYEDRLIAELGQRRDRLPNRFGEWDGTTWRPFDMPADFFPRLSSTGDRLFGFVRTSQNPVVERTYEYSGGSWHAWDSTFAFNSGPVRSLPIEYAGEVFLYGNFSSIDDQPVQGFARAVGDAWVPVTLPLQSVSIVSATVHDGLLYLSGQFHDADGGVAYLATFDGASLTLLPATPVGQLFSDGTTLFAARSERVVAWNGSTFVDYWLPPDGFQFAFAFMADGRMCGQFTTLATTDFSVGQIYYLARRGTDGTTDFTSEPIGIRRGDSTINSAFAFPVVYGSEVHLFGNFNQIGAANLPGNRVVKNWTRFTVNGVPLIVTQPDDVITSCGSPVELRATIASGYDSDGSLEYQWYLNGNALSETQFTRGVNTDTLTIPALAQPFTGIYTLAVTNSCGTATSREVYVSGDTPDCRACSPCAADFDFDGGVTGDDVAAYFTAYETNTPCADVDSNGGVDGGDLALFFSIFEAGGC